MPGKRQNEDLIKNCLKIFLKGERIDEKA